MSIGWEHNKFVYDTIFHFDIKDEKIWIQKNDSDIRIALELEAQGVPKSDIVLAIHSPTARLRSDYAAV